MLNDIDLSPLLNFWLFYLQPLHFVPVIIGRPANFEVVYPIIDFFATIYFNLGIYYILIEIVYISS